MSPTLGALRSVGRWARVERSGHSGEAFVAKALETIRQRRAQGLSSTVVFDLDNTLADTRLRTLAIARAFDQAYRSQHFASLAREGVGPDGEATARRLGLPETVVRNFAAYWHREFFRPENLRYDAPVPRMVALAKSAARAGATVVYLTGRTANASAETQRQLARFGLPDADARHVVCKPVGEVDTPSFKTARLRALVEGGETLSWFLTESQRDIAAVQRGAPEVPCVLLDCSFETGPSRVQSGTPVLTQAF